MSEEIEAHIAAVAAFYEPLIMGPGAHLEGGVKLWAHFQAAVGAFRSRGVTHFRGIFERVNELAVARIILTDPTLPDATFAYEPEIATDGSRIDFVVTTARAETIYIEVKTVHPKTEDSEKSWLRHQHRENMFPKNLNYVVDKQWLGAALSNDSFSARSKFMEYTQSFERRLAAATDVRSGRGVLVFCTNGKWHCSELEDFVDFYETSAHRLDDPFSRMEAHAVSDEGIELKRNIAAFGFVKRPMELITAEKWYADVRGPEEFRGQPKN